DLAARVGISPSYLNMIERDRRIVAGGLLVRLATVLDLAPSALSGSEEIRLLSQLTELLSDPALAGTRTEPGEAVAAIGLAPSIVRAVLRLYQAYRESAEAVEALREGLATDPLMVEGRHQVLTLITSIRAFSEILSD